MQNTGDEDWTADNQVDQTCEGNTHHNLAVPKESPIQGKKVGHTRRHTKTFWKPPQKEVNINDVETSHNKPTHAVPVIKTYKSYVKAAMHLDIQS